MTEFKIIEGQTWHCGQMARRLREEQTDAMSRVDLDVHREMRSLFDQSAFRRAWLIDGQLAALGGVTGSPLEATGCVWVAISRLAQRYPVAMIREARRQLGTIMATRTMLVTTLLPDDEQSLRLAVFLGFQAGWEGRGAPALSRFSRRDLMAYIKDTPDIRIPMRDSYAMAVAYREGSAP